MGIRQIRRAVSLKTIAIAGILLLGLQQLWTVLAADSIVIEENLTYGHEGGAELQLDLARPKEGAGPFPAIVFIHGGAWAGGDRKDYRSTIASAARKGFVAATISYRLTQFDPERKKPTVPFPAQIHDCKCAVRWLRSVSDRYHIDPIRIGVSGASAGGHLSLLVGLADEKAELEGSGGHADQSSRVQAVVNFCGPTELSQEFEDVPAVRDFLEALCQGTPDRAAEAYKSASPLTYCSSDDPPVLTLHGDKDEIVLVTQAKLLDDAMKKAGARHELVILEGQGHGFQGETGKQAYQAMWAFFEQHLKGR